MNNELSIFDNLTPERLRLMIIFGELFWVGVAIFIYHYHPFYFELYWPFVLVLNLLTLLPFPGILRRMKHGQLDEVLHYQGVSTDESEAELNSFGIWEKSCVGFYLIANAAVMAFILSLLF